MNAGWLVAGLVCILMAGCTSEGGTTNPNLLAPKLVLDQREEGNVTVFVHSAFGERAYDWIRVSVDNRTLVNRTEAFSIEEDLGAAGIHLTIEAGVADQRYALQVRIDEANADGKLRVSVLDIADDEWADPRTTGLPYERILERVEDRP